MQSRAAGDAPRAAIYCRLSEEDADKADPGQDSRSIQNQKSMLVRYAVEQGWQIYNIYSDDDYTGSDRERPQFNRLLEDARRGCFDIVLCKSQSRFTREMELVEKYIHGLFVEWSVRFVGYADNADTANRGNKKARQINGLVNEWYLEDMSQNIRTVLDAKRRQGEFVGSFASYGYRKDPQDKHRLLVDEPAAAVVRRIYALYLSGWGASRIAAQLNREQVPNPSAYKKQNNPAFNRGRSTALAELWSDSTVLGILKKQVYTGTTVQHVNEKISYKSKRLRRLPPERRAVVQGTHAAVIDTETWEAVQRKLAEGGAEQRREGRRDALAGKCRCALCGGKLQSKYGRAGKYLRCRTHAVAPERCPGVSIRRDEAAQCVLEALQDCMARYLDREYLARHLRPPEAAAHRQEQLALRAARLEQAQRDCKDRFRKDILFRMKDDIFNARRQFRELNKVMEQLTYGEEVYRFELEPSRDPQLAAFYQVIVDKGNQQMTDGDSLDNLAATADPVYERQVDALMEKIMADVDENTRARQEGRTTSGATLSDYVDYRTYLDYDIKVTNTVSGQQAYLSRVSRDSSGGENQAPFYVAICASLLQIYQKSENSIRLVLLDEAFSKMTSDRIRPMMELFRRLQLQVLLISTVEKSTAIQPYCDITYSIVRHGDANAIAPFYRAGTLADAPEKETEYE